MQEDTYFLSHNITDCKHNLFAIAFHRRFKKNNAQILCKSVTETRRLTNIARKTPKVASAAACNNTIQPEGGNESNNVEENLPGNPNEGKPRSMTPSVSLRPNGLRSCLLGHKKNPHSLQSIQSIATTAFSLTGEHWVSRGGDTHQVSSGEKDLIRDLQTRGCRPRWSYLPAPDLGINFFLGHATRYGRKSLVHLAA